MQETSSTCCLGRRRRKGRRAVHLRLDTCAFFSCVCVCGCVCACCSCIVCCVVPNCHCLFPCVVAERLPLPKKRTTPLASPSMANTRPASIWHVLSLFPVPHLTIPFLQRRSQTLYHHNTHMHTHTCMHTHALDNRMVGESGSGGYPPSDFSHFDACSHSLARSLTCFSSPDRWRKTVQQAWVGYVQTASS